MIDTLEGVSDDRRCFRMIGGVLVERTVREVLSALEDNRDKVGGREDMYQFAFTITVALFSDDRSAS